MLKFNLLLAAVAVALGLNGQEFVPAEHATFQTDRKDGRWVSSRGWVNSRMEANPPILAFRPGMTPAEMQLWQQGVSGAMKALMKHPEVPNPMPSKKLGEIRRDGFRTEKWELYPLEGLAVPILVQIPDSATAQNPAAAGVLCIPGWGQTKEEVAAEPRLWVAEECGPDFKPNPSAMGRSYVGEGYVAVSIDNPGAGETSDLEREAGQWRYDFPTLSRALLEQGWSYLGLMSYVDRCALQWMRQQEYIPDNRLVVSGFSFGTEPLMVIGALEPDVFAFVYNDFLCDTRERALVMTLPNGEGYRPWPNDIEHLIPGFLRFFDFPDLVANLAPRPVICTEGGMDRDFNRVRGAYTAAGAPEAFTGLHYAKFQDAASRQQLAEMPHGISGEEFFRLANVDPPHHGFKAQAVLPWLRQQLQK